MHPPHASTLTKPQPANPMSAPETTPASPTRRRILAWTGAGAIGGIACYLGWPQGPGTPATTGTATPSRVTTDAPAGPAPELHEIPASAGPALPGREDFLPHLKSAFRLDDGTDCTLTEVGAAQTQTAPGATFTSFSLVFTAPVRSDADGRIHQVTHPDLGTLDLFLSPVGHSQEHTYLEAVFSQRV